MKHLWVILFLLFIALPAKAAEINLSGLKNLPVLHEGRIKPLSSFARLNYQPLRDTAYVNDDKAIQFLAEAVFNPSDSANEKIIVIRDENLRILLGLDPKQQEFSLADIVEKLQPHEKNVAEYLQQDPKTLTADQRSLVSLFDKVVGYTQLLRSFTLLLPLDIHLKPEDMKLYSETPDTISFYSAQGHEENLRRAIEKLIKKRGRDLKNYTGEEQNLVELSYQLDEIRKGGMGNTLFRVIPSSWDKSWYSPWEMVLSGRASPESQTIMTFWRNMAQAYRAGDQAAFDKNLLSLKHRMTFQDDVSSFRLSAEGFYYQAHLIPISLALYLIAFIAIGMKKRRIAFPVALASLALHTASILLRILILERPPVSTLFESVLFVGFIAVSGLLLSEWRYKNNTSLFLAALTGIILQTTALGFASNGDTLQTLQAVLNTPFWLAVHVLMITAGYGICVITSVFAQSSFIWRQKIHDGLLWFTATLSLLLTSVGTILGGLWADQSWGRFWGWDPKENGALLIVLWLTWILHAKLSAHINDAAFRAGLAFLTVVVALAWFGVNLLATGLHSYGFTSGIATALFSFIGLQSALIGWLWHRERKIHA